MAPKSRRLTRNLREIIARRAVFGSEQDPETFAAMCGQPRGPRPEAEISEVHTIGYRDAHDAENKALSELALDIYNDKYDAETQAIMDSLPPGFLAEVQGIYVVLSVTPEEFAEAEAKGMIKACYSRPHYYSYGSDKVHLWLPERKRVKDADSGHIFHVDWNDSTKDYADRYREITRGPNSTKAMGAKEEKIFKALAKFYSVESVIAGWPEIAPFCNDIPEGAEYTAWEHSRRAKKAASEKAKKDSAAKKREEMLAELNEELAL